MKVNRPLVLLLLIVISFPLRAGDGFCELRNSAFSNGEMITLKVFYTVVGAYFGAGEASFTTTLEKMAGKPVYHIVGDGKTYSFYDKFFKVRDKYETYIDTATLQPYRFIRNVYEGGYKKYENVTFNKTTNSAITAIVGTIDKTRNITLTEPATCAAVTCTSNTSNSRKYCPINTLYLNTDKDKIRNKMVALRLSKTRI